MAGSYSADIPSSELIGTSDQTLQHDSHPPHSAHTETIPLEQTISTESSPPETGSSLPVQIGCNTDNNHLSRRHSSGSLQQQHQNEHQGENAQQYSNLSVSFPTDTPSSELIATSDHISQYDGHPHAHAHTTTTIPLEQTRLSESSPPESRSSLPAPLDIESDLIPPLRVVPISEEPAQISEEPTELTSPEKSPIQNAANSGDTQLIEKRSRRNLSKLATANLDKANSSDDDRDSPKTTLSAVLSASNRMSKEEPIPLEHQSLADRRPKVRRSATVEHPTIPDIEPSKEDVIQREGSGNKTSSMVMTLFHLALKTIKGSKFLADKDIKFHHFVRKNV